MKKYLVLLLLPAFTLLQYCSSSKKAKSQPQAGKVTFDDNVKPLVTTNCAPCHTMGNHSHLGVYATAVEHADDIIRRVNLTPSDKGFMPFKHDKLPDSVIAVFAQWKADGLLEKANP